MTATHELNSTLAMGPVLYVSLELGWFTWKLACTIGPGQKPRLRSVKARRIDVLLAEIQAAKKRFGLPDDAHAAPGGGQPWWGSALVFGFSVTSINQKPRLTPNAAVDSGLRR